MPLTIWVIPCPWLVADCTARMVEDWSDVVLGSFVSISHTSRLRFSWIGAPVAEQAPLDVLDFPRFTKERVVAQVDHPAGRNNVACQ